MRPHRIQKPYLTVFLTMLPLLLGTVDAICCFYFPAKKNDFVVKRAFKQDQIVHMDGKFQVIRYFIRECTVAEVF